MRFLLLTIPLAFATLTVHAEEVYQCKHAGGTSMSWEMGNWYSGEGMKSKINPKENHSISIFVKSKTEAILKGNAGVETLTRNGDDYFFERTGTGTLVVWRVLPGKQGRPTYIVQTKAYDLWGPATFTDLFECQ